MAQKVAIVCDWLVGGGAERVVHELHLMYPEAPIYTAYYDNRSFTQFNKADIRVSYMQRFPFSKLRKLLPILRQRWFEKLDLSEYDLVISSSGAEAKGIKTLPTTVHINYCHTPTHYYWVRYQEYMDNPGMGWLNPIARFGLKHLLKYSRKWDYKAAQRPNYIIANSKAVKERIEQYYNRESEVIHPPVDIERFKPKQFDQAKSGFVTAGRQTPYKRIDLAIAACTKANLPLTVIGKGPEHLKLRRKAGSTVTFLRHIADNEIAKYFQTAEAFIFPNEDDFGITPVEAMAAGTPVVAYEAGGALDYVVPGKTGVFFNEQDPDKLAEILAGFQADQFKPESISKYAENFSADRFRKEIKEYVSKTTKENAA